MNKAKFTPGPWTVEAVNSERMHDICLDYEVKNAGNPVLVAAVFFNEDYGITITPRQADANARLIAAAPDLLAACKDMVAAFEVLDRRFELTGWTMSDREALGLARAAIAKATGETTTQDDDDPRGSGEAP